MKKCLICGRSSKFEKAYNLQGFFYETCLRCGGATLQPREKALKESQKVYTPEYFDWEAPKGLKKVLYTTYLHKDYPDWIEKERPGVRGRILDVGAGIPTFLLKMRKKGWDVFAQEFSKDQGEKIARAIGRDRVFVGDFEKIRLPKNYFDVITFWHVLEHVKFPDKTIKKAKSLLRTGGKIFIEVPNFMSFNLRLMKKNYSLMSIPAHLFYYNDRSLLRLFKNNGFDIKGIAYPLKYNLTFSDSLIRALKGGIGTRFAQAVFYVALPLSLGISTIMSFFGASEIVRVSAQKRG